MKDLTVRSLDEVTDELKGYFSDAEKLRDDIVATLMYVEKHKLFKEKQYKTLTDWLQGEMPREFSRSQKWNLVNTSKVSLQVGRQVSTRQAQSLRRLPEEDRVDAFEEAQRESELSGKGITQAINEQVEKKTPANKKAAKKLEVMRSMLVGLNTQLEELASIESNPRLEEAVSSLISDIKAALRYWSDTQDEFDPEDKTTLRSKKLLGETARKAIYHLGNIGADEAYFEHAMRLLEASK